MSLLGDLTGKMMTRYSAVAFFFFSPFDVV